MDEMDKIKELKQKLIFHEMALDDAPFHGWSGEFINGYALALKRVKADIEK
ncbi:hypothetical protein QB910_000122 [Dabrowskivirus KKP3916]|uniref:Uncharacterized protein n=1 Tax=Alicyclobacillus phage KKP_3916 TaxID=3040651 RepID=A0AAT9V8F6_9CAUD|nr:hypothetical protein QB910_000122 [Alicyclobacillus phage KKP 3916]